MKLSWIYYNMGLVHKYVWIFDIVSNVLVAWTKCAG